jgi:hypothetical protein
VNHDPRRPDILRKRDDSLGGATLGGIAVAVVLFLGLAIYMLNSGNRHITAQDSPRLDNTSVPSTTGQGNTRTMPGGDQNVPNPSPPSAPSPKPQQQ